MYKRGEGQYKERHNTLRVAVNNQINWHLNIFSLSSHIFYGRIDRKLDLDCLPAWLAWCFSTSVLAPLCICAHTSNSQEEAVLLEVSLPVVGHKKEVSYLFFFQSCWPTRDHLGRSTGISNPVWHLPQVVPRVDDHRFRAPQAYTTQLLTLHHTSNSQEKAVLLEVSLPVVGHKKEVSYLFFFQSCWPTRDHIGRSTGISNPVWHLPQVVAWIV